MGVRNIDIDLYNVAHILQIEERTIILCISCALGKKEYSNHAMPINLQRSKFHAGTGFSLPYFFLEKLQSCPVEGKQKLA